MIVGFTVRLRQDAEPQGTRAWTSVLVEGNQSRAVIASLLGEPRVLAMRGNFGHRHRHAWPR